METGRRTMLFQEVNDRIYDLLESAEPDLPGEFLCECGKECGRRVELVPAAYAELRERGGVVRSADCRRRGLLRRRAKAPVAGSLPALG
ncbi:MAG TPA: hypothetical protein VFA37_08855 [Gaiellaceae bacterium]|nr:hypothetical protein [Gaiellaceae bacterium]